MVNDTDSPILVSACMLGICTRYNGKIKEIAAIHKLLQDAQFIPVCPEQLGGLSTPRTAADLRGGDGADVLHGTAQVITKEGTDCTEQFLRGAHEVLKIAELCNCRRAILKARSPSCAVTGKIGVTAALLKKHGIKLEEL